MKYFAYGMNTNLDQMASRCPGAVCLGAAWIDDYEFVFRTHADIVESPGSICYGVLWDIDKKHLQSLDVLEGYPYYYNRFLVKVSTGDYFIFALTYQMNDQSHIHEPGPGYLEMVREGYQQNGVPTNQIDRAINRICSSSIATNTELVNTWSPTTQDFA
jgi:gamma-glutamylcyclotransferase (GGCT)/AIG2-like uncharacterized protein YtfP